MTGRRTIGAIMIGGLLTGAAIGTAAGLDDLARPTPAHPDYLAWETCAEYIPRWLLPYMRDCVEDARAIREQAARPNGQERGPGRFMMCGFL